MRRREGRGRLLLTGLALLFVLVGLAALVLHGFAWTWQPLLIAAALSHQLMWAAPIGALLALALRRWYLGGVAVVLTAVVVAVQLPATVARTAPAGRTITVLQANLKIGAADPDALVRLVRENKVDLLATEELTDAEADRLVAAGLPALLPHRYLRPLRDGGSGSGIWSRWPLSQQQDVPGFWLSTVRATVAAPTGPLSFVAVHLTPPYPFPDRMWLDEVPRLRALLRKQPAGAPVLAPGDYNATTGHAQFRDLLTGGYRDALDDAGAGYLPSYPNDRWFGPVIGIDHVLLRDAVGTSARTLELAGSDHRALLAQIVVPGQG